MNIKTKVLKTLVDKKKFTRQDIYKAIYKAQGIKKIPNKFPNGFYGTNICEWKYDGLITPIEKGVYIMGNNADLYLNDVKEYRRRKNGKSEKKLFPYQQQDWEIKLSRARRINIEESKKELMEKIKARRTFEIHSDKFKHLIGKRIKDVRYMQPSECGNLGWNKSSLIIELDDNTCLIPQMDDEGNDGGSMLHYDYKHREDYIKDEVIYTI